MRNTTFSKSEILHFRKFCLRVSFLFLSKRMHKNLIFSTGPACEICRKIFTKLRNLKQYQHTVHEKSVLFSCGDCNYTTPRKSSLNRHMKRHANTLLTPNLSPKVARRQPNIIDPPTNDRFLEQQEIHSMLDQNTQRGFGVTPTDVAEEFINFFNRNSREEQTKIFVTSTCKIFIALATQKPIIAVPVFFSDIYTMIALLSLKPLPKP